MCSTWVRLQKVFILTASNHTSRIFAAPSKTVGGPHSHLSWSRGKRHLFSQLYFSRRLVVVEALPAFTASVTKLMSRTCIQSNYSQYALFSTKKLPTYYQWYTHLVLQNVVRGSRAKSRHIAPIWQMTTRGSLAGRSTRFGVHHLVPHGSTKWFCSSPVF